MRPLNRVVYKDQLGNRSGEARLLHKDTQNAANQGECNFNNFKRVADV